MVPLCAPEEASKLRKDFTRILQEHEEERKWTEQVQQRETELGQTLDADAARSAPEGRREESGPAVQTVHEQEKAARVPSFPEAKASLPGTHERLASPQEAGQHRRQRVEGSVLSRVYRKHIQDHGSPGPFWERELESLHHVMEMKNERIRELERQLVAMETLKEKNLLLELKITTLEQENEDLHFRARNRAAMSRQLWEDLLQVLEKESQNGQGCSRRRSR